LGHQLHLTKTALSAVTNSVCVCVSGIARVLGFCPNVGVMQLLHVVHVRVVG